MPDPRTHLPDGAWSLVRTRLQRKADISCFWVTATDKTTGDRVDGYVTVGELAGYSLAEWGLPSSLPLDRVWHLGRVEPRSEKARGGTKALIKYLGDLADAASIWITTEVKTGDAARNRVVIALLAKHGGFEFAEAEYEEMQFRKPRTPAPSIGGTPTSGAPSAGKLPP